MFGVLLLLVAVAALLAFMVLKRSSKKGKHFVKSMKVSNKQQHLPDTSDKRFHCVSIEHYGNCCEKANEVKGKRFLSKEAPEIPMEECTYPDCHCRYQHYDDRRHNEDERRMDYGVTHDLYGLFGEENRRENRRGRRSND
ncbi:hypothetical protein [Shewanella acanthi]|uniref:hypothetical protein n=1 Tax=Shewanella acanthi TaxID=2864212 RepID=UPI001C6575F3|nr:hypothetical protein [Shewanella acanthi]QYJ78373.1 hypothetical protein K0H61_14900 [Shewanella acanthi]